MTNMRGQSPTADQAGAALAPNTVRSMPLSQPQQVFFHLDFRRALEMHRRKVIAILLVAVAFSMFHVARRWNTYKAASQVYVQPAPHRVIENGPAQQWPYDANTYESYIQQQVLDVTRPDVLAAAVKRIPGWRGESESEQAAADRLGTDIEVVREGTAYEVSITARAGSADKAAQMANAVASAFIESATKQERAGDPQRLQLLRDERDRIVKELAADRAEQDDLTRKLGMASTSGSSPNPIDDQIAQTRAELVKARTDNDVAAARLTALAGQKNSNAALDAEADALVAADPGLVSMKTALNKRRSDLISQMANLTPNHPLYKQDAEELAKINTSLDSMTRELRAKAGSEIQQRLKNDLERTSTVEARLNGQLAQLTSAAGTAAPRLQRSSELAADIQRLQSRFTVVDEQFRNLTMENNAPGAVYLASAALPPLHAEHGKVLRNGFIVILAGLVLALGAALLAYNLDPGVYIALDVERVLGFPPMAQIPDLYEVGTGVAEEYMLRVAAAVEHAHQQGLLNSCIITGVAAGAGATTISTRVSSLLEAMGRETVHVDAVGSPQPATAALPAGTDLVPANRGSRSTALLQQMNEEVGEDTVVITDTAPLLVSGETEYMARFVDAAIVVIESGMTTKTQLREIARTLQRLEVGSVGFVLNHISLQNADPGFRDSVRAVEAHVRTQTRAAERAPAKTQPGIETGIESGPEPRIESRPEPAEPQPAAEQHSSAAFDRLWNILSEPEKDVEKAVIAPAEAAPTPVPPVQSAAPRSTAVDAGAAMSVESAGPANVQAPQATSSLVAEEAPFSDRVEAANPPQQWGLPEYPCAAPRPAQPANVAVDRSEEFIAASAPMNKAAQDTPRSESRKPAASFVSRPLRGREPVRFSPAEPQTSTVPAPAPNSERREVPPAIPNYPSVPPADEVRQAAAPAAFANAVEIPRSGNQTWSAYVPASAPEPVAAPAPRHVTPATQPAIEQPVSQPLAFVAAGPDSMMKAPAADDVYFSAASRLGGLRTLMTSLGIRNLQKESELSKAFSEPESRSERQPERAVFAQPQSHDHVAHSRERAATAEVTASPEIIPPRAAIEHVEREKEVSRPVKSPRVSRWDSVDDVETLPSLRGQYRKRR